MLVFRIPGVLAGWGIDSEMVNRAFSARLAPYGRLTQAFGLGWYEPRLRRAKSAGGHSCFFR